MKNFIGFFTVTFIFISSSVFAQVAINTDGSSPDASSMLDVKSATTGMLIPRMTTTRRTAISSPANGLLVFDTDTKSFWFYEGVAPGWKELIASNNNSGLSDTDGDTKIQVEESPDEDIIRFDMAGTEFFVMDSGRLDVTNTGRSVFIGTRAGANDDLSDNHNNFIGYYAGEANITGIENTAVGYFSLRYNKGRYNTAMGTYSLYSNQTGEYNSAYGYISLYSNLTGKNNTAIGHSALFKNSSGSYNTAVGNAALFSHTSGAYNTA
ncbi:MAG: hypothetical protein L3J31_06615, partial [Bacteroidales bacterium]|nr:hypothetical protein [Bacteroidales bacterium]